MKEIWKCFVKYAAEDSFAVKESKKRVGVSDAALAYTEGAYNAAYTCAVAAGYKEHYLQNVDDSIDCIMEDYIEDGGDAYRIENHMDEIFKKLEDMGFDGQE